jgi:hypothetical protein
MLLFTAIEQSSALLVAFGADQYRVALEDR